ncbi:hypothetical protein OGAPHI_006512 [Ogataea philodendri]|uniref:Thiamin pyrophosphokinase thiamin-binding domain-containing protein n=1 Tax=Ogataea philodendri TaxID=1378263 RepID=A0A9P8NYQ5_9ASCO|nr:uncharacterized protein OGAPHI_006512 [Ogataea philodendri]KAH3661662.1 hypothetical protein OGAPHI_006512 [Ogataea philodendri]
MAVFLRRCSNRAAEKFVFGNLATSARGTLITSCESALFVVFMLANASSSSPTAAESSSSIVESRISFKNASSNLTGLIRHPRSFTRKSVVTWCSFGSDLVINSITPGWTSMNTDTWNGSTLGSLSDDLLLLLGWSKYPNRRRSAPSVSHTRAPPRLQNISLIKIVFSVVMGPKAPALNHVVENPDTIRMGAATGSATIRPLAFGDGSEECVLIILNQEIRLPVEEFNKLWRSSRLVVCADGGANRLFKYAQKHGLDPKELVPDYIIGDLDSIDPDVAAYYVSNGTRMKKQASQYFWDLDKSVTLCYFALFCPDFNLDDYDDHDGLSTQKTTIKNDLEQNVLVYLLGSIGGRFDQTLQTTAQLLKYHTTIPNFRFIMRNNEYDEYILFVPAGQTFVALPQREKTPSGRLQIVGLLPLYGPVRLSTKGLKWDVTDWESSMAGSISSSNAQVGDTGFFIDSSGPLLINIEI